MNKFKKLAIAAVSVVMAGTMAASFAACGGNNGKKPSGNDSYFGEDVYGIMNEDGTINYNVYKDRDEDGETDAKVNLNVAIGYKGLETSTSFRTIGAEIKLPNRTTAYSQGDMKPAWVQMGEDLNISWTDVYTGVDTAGNLAELTSKNYGTTSDKLYAHTDLFTTDLSEAVSASVKGTANILNLAKYLNRMPNFRNFLNQNPVVYLSLLQDGMSTVDGSGQEILVAPYFDGYDDIERYCIIRHDWAKKLLNGTSSTGSTATFASECAEATSVTSFMGSTNYTVDALTADGSAVQKITKDYGKALAAAKSESTPLGAAFKAIAGVAYNGESGNIVDIMNVALAANKNATGAQLVDLYRAYIEVCYTKGGSAYFTSENRANVFVGYDACWDVDDLVAILRCVKTNAVPLVGAGKKLDGLAPRSGQNNRTPVMVSLACQLFGIRGGDSRNEYTYIDHAGNLKDARTDEAFYEAMAKMNLLFKEGLIADYSGMATFQTSSGLTQKSSTPTQYFMVYDYSQTQTLAGFLAEDSAVSHGDFPSGVPSGYYFAPVITPISKWDVDANGTIAADEYFRFTDSWRSTKTGGLAVNAAVENDEVKLAAALQFVDFLYSTDGQIVSTFGPMANDAEGDGGFWYNEVAGADDKNVFTYKGVKYKGSEYKGHYTPTITDNLYKSFKGGTVNGWRPSMNTNVSSAALSFTNYARYLIGATLPVGVKDQSFENQLTSKMGQAGAGVVGVALDKGVVRGLSLELDVDDPWYICAPTGLPVSEVNQGLLDATVQDPFRYLTGTKKKGGSDNFFSIMNWIILNGTSGTYSGQDVSVSYTSISDLLSKSLSGNTAISTLAGTRQFVYNTAWGTAKDYWEYLSNHR